ncbi:MAG: lytic polysaccharide monooxygenase auxiliary activity family 9 protein, partial [Endozoicomonas sp.]
MMIKPARLSIMLSFLLSFLYIEGTHAHGWTAYPIARQAVCAEDGGYWSSTDGSTIPNQACRSAYLQSGVLPFVQANEFSINITDYLNMSAVMAAIPTGLLCSAGAPSKSGMDIPSSSWQKTKIAPGTFKLRWKATAAHNPSYWQIYLSKPEFNAALKQLGWDDLELINNYGNIPVVSG